jgi:hypothetical protein
MKMETIKAKKVEMKSGPFECLIYADGILLGCITDFKISRAGKNAISVEITQEFNGEKKYVLEGGQYELIAESPEVSRWR